MDGKIVGVLLAGGMSRRFGSAKSFAEKDGKPFYHWSIEALRPMADSLIIITNEHLKEKFNDEVDMDVFTDVENYSGKGPLAGIYTAMVHREASWYAIIPTDVPFMESKVFERLWDERKEGVQAVIPIVNGKFQPLIGLYHHTLKPTIRELLEDDRLMMRALLDKVETQYVPFVEETPFININERKDYDVHIRDGLRDNDA